MKCSVPVVGDDMERVTVMPGEQNKRMRSANAALLHADEAAAKIRSRLAAVANELRIAAEGPQGTNEKLLTLAKRFDEEATGGEHS
jgi:hypothetical protein